MSYVIVNKRRYEEIQDAVMDIEKNEVESAEIDIYDDNGDYIETQEITAEDNYRYHAYAVFEEAYGIEWKWYGDREICYNTEDEAYAVIDHAEPGRYKITKITQTVSEYIEDADIDTIEVEE
jgi:hypothetical protein